MQTFRYATLIIALAFASTPLLRAEQTGTNPHPQIAVRSNVQTVLYSLASYLGI